MTKKIKHFFQNNTILILSILFLVLFSGTMQLFAADPPPPVGGYSPGATLDPGCLPTDSDCIVNLGTAFTIDADNNMFAGTNAGTSLTTGTNNFFAGVGVGQATSSGSSNTAIGNLALSFNVLGSGNSAVGYQSLYSNTGGSNTALGYQVLYTNTSGGENTGIGYQVLYSNTNARGNTASGSYSLRSNTVGNNNTASGYYSLFSSVAGSYGTAFGSGAMQYSNSTATPFSNYSTAVGYEALRGSTTASDNTGNSNTALGYQALRVNSSGYSNTAIGTEALNSNVSGYANDAFGVQSLYLNQTGYSNTGLGAASLYKNLSGYENTAIGSGAMYGNTSGYLNTAVGKSALGFSPTSTGNSNVALGHQALAFNTTGSTNVAIGKDALYSNDSGSGNVAIGYFAGYMAGPNYNYSGSYNIFIGYNSGPDTPTQLDNAIAIGKNSVVGASNSLALGGLGADAVNVGIGTSTPTYRLSVVDATTAGVIGEFTNSDGTCTLDPGDVTGWSCPSDENLKKDISNLELGLSELNQLRPVTYRLINEDDFIDLSMGLIAQEVEPIFPKLVKTQKDGTLSLNYGGLTPVMIKAIQELDLKVENIYNLNPESSWVNNLISWLGNTANGIGDFFANRIRTKEICISDETGETCITRFQLDQLLTTGGTSGSPAPEPILNPEPTEETCSDGIQNQDETGIDEGGICFVEIEEPEPEPVPELESEPEM